MDRKQIIQEIIQTMTTELKMVSRQLSEEDVDKDFVKDLKLLARDLMVLFFELEKRFDISISEEQYEKHGFKTIGSIVDIVEECVV